MVCTSCGVPSSKPLCTVCQINIEAEAERKANQQKEIMADMQRGYEFIQSLTGISPRQVVIAGLAIQCLKVNPMSSAEDAVHMARKIFDLSK